jgi:ferredoxin, 2Fe-2S
LLQQANWVAGRLILVYGRPLKLAKYDSANILGDAEVVKVTFKDHTGEERTVEARGGLSLMEAALHNNIPGIEAECGGACSCATCHVFVTDAWLEKVGPPSDIESDMLAAVDEVRPSSRLSCQVKLTDALDGLVVETPAAQG